MNPSDYATDYVEDPGEGKSIVDVLAEGYRQDVVIFFPRCFVPEGCPAPRYRGYFLCEDKKEKRCTLTYRQIETEVCRLGEYSMLAKEMLKKNNLIGKVLVLPGGRQIVDVCLGDGLPRAVVGVACPPDLKEGREKMDTLGVKSFLVPLTKLKYDVCNIKKVTIQSCFENVVKNGTEAYVKTIQKAIDYAIECKNNNSTVAQYLEAQKQKKQN